MESPAEIAAIFKCLSAEARVRIIQMLGRSPLCVNALARRLNMTQGAASQHLRILRDAGLIVPEKRGYFTHYRLNPATMKKWLDLAGDLLEIRMIPLPCFNPAQFRPEDSARDGD